jgi:hypothetical protein
MPRSSPSPFPHVPGRQAGFVFERASPIFSVRKENTLQRDASITAARLLAPPRPEEATTAIGLLAFCPSRRVTGGGAKEGAPDGAPSLPLMRQVFSPGASA